MDTYFCIMILSAMYNTLANNGLKLPIVGSTDCHSVFGNSFNTMFTVLFADGDDITGAVADGYTAAVLSLPGENAQVFGDYRMVKYAYFLLDNYFPVHNELCSASGDVILEYILGNKEMKPLAEALEKRVADFEKKFFGR